MQKNNIENIVSVISGDSDINSIIVKGHLLSREYIMKYVRNNNSLLASKTKKLDFETLLAMARTAGVENSLIYRLDVVFKLYNSCHSLDNSKKLEFNILIECNIRKLGSNSITDDITNYIAHNIYELQLLCNR